MSLADRIIESHRVVAGDVLPDWWLHPTSAEFNELREELTALRAVIAKVESDQCGCLGGPFTIEWAAT